MTGSGQRDDRSGTTGASSLDPVDVGSWEPRRRQEIPLPENLGREVRRLVWWLDSIGCTRSPFLGHADCFEIEDIKPSSMCARCRALAPYRSVIKR